MGQRDQKVREGLSPKRRHLQREPNDEAAGGVGTYYDRQGNGYKEPKEGTSEGQKGLAREARQ